MQNEFLEILRCPRTRQELSLRDATYVDGRIQSGSLVSTDGAHSYPIRDFIPRFVPASNYADNFGMQWNQFRATQLDSQSGHPISADRFWQATGWRTADMKGQWILDAGCGAGRFAEIALQAGANVVALDLSGAVDACYANLKHHPNLHVVQGDIYYLPFQPASFQFVYSLGVLQHTPDVSAAFASLPPFVKAGGQLCTDFYWKRFQSMLNVKYILRPLTKRLDQGMLFRVLHGAVPPMLKVSQYLGRIPFLGRYIKRLVPVADYTGIYPLSQQQIEEWALLDTFDMLGPQFDNPQTASTIRGWMTQAGFEDVDVFHATLLVVRGSKS